MTDSSELEKLRPRSGPAGGGRGRDRLLADPRRRDDPDTSSAPADAGDAASWADSSTRLAQIDVALGLLPFAGIAFLWFIGVIRDHIGPREDRFFATVFLGSGVIFLALMFTAGGGRELGAAGPGVDPAPRGVGVRPSIRGRPLAHLRPAHGGHLRHVGHHSAASRLGLLGRWLILAGYLTAVSLLLVVGFVPGLELLFPLWVLLVSVHILGTWAGRAAHGAAVSPEEPDRPRVLAATMNVTEAGGSAVRRGRSAMETQSGDQQQQATTDEATLTHPGSRPSPPRSIPRPEQG